MTKVTLTNSQSAYVDKSQSAKHVASSSYLFTDTYTSSSGKYSFLFFAIKPPIGATLRSGLLTLRAINGNNVSETLQVDSISQAWNSSTITWGNQPTAYAAPSASTTQVSTDNQWWTVDVTALVQTVADGVAWFGFRIARPANMRFCSEKWANAAFRPRLDLEWEEKPDAPTTLSPAGDRFISLAKPILRMNFHDVVGDTTMRALQVQIAANGFFENGNTPDWDSGTQLTSIPQLDLSNSSLFTTAPPGLAVGARTYWRGRVQDGAGLWSDWSKPVSYQRSSQGSLAFTNPSGSTTADSSPPVSWSFSGTQRSYELLVADTSGRTLWTSGKRDSTDTTATPANRTLSTVGQTYRLILRVWDNINRETTPNDTPYVQISKDVVFTPSSTVTPVNSLSAQKLSPSIGIGFTFRRTEDPDSFSVLRDGEVVRSNIVPGDAKISSGFYYIEDRGASARTSHTWAIAANVNGALSSSNPTYTGKLTMIGPWLMEKDGSNAIMFLNKDNDPSNLDGSQVLIPMASGANPILITQGVAGETGTFKGTLANDAVNMTTADVRARWKALRKKQGQTLTFHYIDRVMSVIVSNMTLESKSYPDGTVDDIVSFSYWEVDYK